MKNALFAFAFILSTPLSIFAQNEQKMLQNGTSEDAFRINFKNMMELREKFPKPLSARSATVYVPVCFHLVAKDDGTGRIFESDVLELLCAWNQFYQTQNIGIQFFIKDNFNYINNSVLYSTPATAAGNVLLLQNKRADALNIFISNRITDNTSATIIGLYSNRQSASNEPYSNDYILLASSSVNSKIKPSLLINLSCTLFGLTPTFAFINPSYSSTDSVCAPAFFSNIELEKVARTGATANCNRAADGFCDTPADYATFAINDIINCVYSGKIKDADCVPLSPDVSNIMSFGALNCSNNTISGEQINAMKNNYTNLSQRKYLRDGNKIPNLTELNAPSLLSPLNTTTPFFNDIELDWTDVLGAIGYAVELSTSSQFSPSLSHSIQSQSSNIRLNASNTPAKFLTANRAIFWRIRPFGSYKTCAIFSETKNFTTGMLSANQEIEGIDNVSLAPVPLSKTDFLTLKMNSTRNFDAQIEIYDVLGRLIQSEKRHFDVGNNAINIPVLGFNKGLFFLKIKDSKGSIERRFVIE